MLISDLRREAGSFRDALEALAPRPRQYAALRNFPKGCCKDSSFLFARYLDIEFRVTALRYVWGTRDSDTFDWHTHGWLEVGDTIVDLTADQFGEIQDRIVVSPRGDSPWHSTWPNQTPSRYPALWSFHPEAGRDFEATLEDLRIHIAQIASRTE